MKKVNINKQMVETFSEIEAVVPQIQKITEYFGFIYQMTIIIYLLELPMT